MIRSLFITSLAVFFSIGSSATAAILWTEDFDIYADGASVNGQATTTGSGTWNTNGPVAVNADQQLAFTADGGRDAIQVDSTTSATFGGRLIFDIASVNAGTFFIQLTEGGRSTNNNPTSGYALTVNSAQDGISTDVSAPSTVTIVFNTTALPLTYTAPDSSTATVGVNAYDFWVDSSLVDDDATSTPNTTAPPSSISTFVTQTFNNQNGASFVFDDFQFEAFEQVPEPSATVMAILGIIGFGLRRRR